MCLPYVQRYLPRQINFLNNNNSRPKKKKKKIDVQRENEIRLK